jgi:hypothetical protein
MARKTGPSRSDYRPSSEHRPKAPARVARNTGPARPTWQACFRAEGNATVAAEACGATEAECARLGGTWASRYGNLNAAVETKTLVCPPHTHTLYIYIYI